MSESLITNLQYAINSYKPVAGEIMVVGTAIRNMYAVSNSIPFLFH